jgi:S-formylglutathione hydrolase FrmB
MLTAPSADAAGRVETIEIPSSAVDAATANFNPGGALKANVLLPEGYDPRRAYPLLLLLHGVGDTYADWAKPGKGAIATTAAGLGAIVVMPEGAKGFYTDWFNDGRRGDPAWETYVLRDVLGAVRRRYRIRPERRFHAIAGLSMGGLGAAFLGGRLPGYFGSVAVFSGFVDHRRPEVATAFGSVTGTPYERIFGPVGGSYAVGHNPRELVENLRRSRLFVGVGDGTVDPALGVTSPAAAFAGGILEGAVIRPQVDAFVAAARTAGLDLTYAPHAGVHDWPSWRKDLQAAIAWDLFAPVAEAPRTWTNRTVARSGELFGLRYRFGTAPERVVRLERDGDVLRVDGSGTDVTVRTPGGCAITSDPPAEFAIPARPCERVRVTVRPRVVVAGRRVTLRVRTSRAARVRVAGRVLRTGRDRRARTTVRFGRPGRRVVRATAQDRRPGRTSLTVR